MAHEDLAEVVEQVPAVRDLERAGGTFGDRPSVLGRAVTGDDFDAGMGAEPRRDRVGRPVRQEIDGPPPLEVDEDRPPRSPSAPRPIIDAKGAGRSSLLNGGTVDETEDRVGARRHSQFPKEPGTGLGSDGEADPDLSGGEPVGPSRARSNEIGERLSERSPRAHGVLTAKAANRQPEPDRTVADGEVGRQANVGAVNTAGASAALGAGSAPCGRVGGDEEFILGLRYGVKATAGSTATAR